MSYEVKIDGFENQKVEVEMSFWTGTRLLVNGQKAPKGSRRGEMLLTRDDGRQAVVRWKPVALGFDVPQLNVDGEVIKLVEPLKWYQWVWSAIPVVMVFIGGALGAIAGLIALSINAGLFRSKQSEIMKYVITGLVSAAAIVLYLIVASALTMMIGGY